MKRQLAIRAESLSLRSRRYIRTERESIVDIEEEAVSRLEGTVEWKTRRSSLARIVPRVIKLCLTVRRPLGPHSLPPPFIVFAMVGHNLTNLVRPSLNSAEPRDHVKKVNAVANQFNGNVRSAHGVPTPCNNSPFLCLKLKYLS